jgi:hypothetical protein
MLGIMVPIIAIVFGLSIPIVSMIVDYRKRRRLIELHHAERMAAIERGMELPPLPLEVLGPGRTRLQSSLLPGLIWLFVGLGLFLGLGSLAGEDVSRLGAIPAGVGIAYLLYYAVEGRKRERQANGHDQAGTTPRQD